MKKLLFALIFLIANLATAQFNCQQTHQNLQSIAGPSIDHKLRSDTIDVVHYTLNLDFSSLPQSYLIGECKVLFRPLKSGVSSIALDLLKLQVDSIVMYGQSLSYSYNDTLVRAYFTPANVGDSLELSVYYRGNPQGDGSGWGGWHAQSGYFYNLGVGFAANPHTYGRAWFPCFDNFVEKSTYDFFIKTLTPLRPYANGIRKSEVQLSGDTILTHWEMSDPIPTYLASVAISNYIEINDQLSAINGIIPIQLMAKQADSIDLVNSFINLKPGFAALEQAFGPYEWQKIGYAATTVGAMEHATSIHYPVNLINGNLNGEDIMIHELAHHWWGNLVTCETDADMWINEGMAEYCSHLYTEQLYSREHYIDVVRRNAFVVLNTAHLDDRGYKAIQGLDHEYVYGTHVYQKGAMVAHNLRAYLGDNSFFTGLTSLLQNNKFSNLNSTEFRDQLSQISGYSLTDFFDNWVFNPGFPQFSVDSLFVSGHSADIKIGQRLHHAPNLYKGVPVDVTFFSANGDTISKIVICTGTSTVANFSNLPFTPLYAMASYCGSLLSADTYDEYKIDHTGSYPVSYSFMSISANQVSDTAQMISMHHWAGPKGKLPTNGSYRLSNDRFWTIQGNKLDKVDLTAKVTLTPNPNSLDYALIKNSRDSLLMLYREDATQAWAIYPHQQRNVIGITASIELTKVIAGDYVLANSDQQIGLEENKARQGSIEVYPNPAKDKLNIRLPEERDLCAIALTDVSGKLLMEKVYSGVDTAHPLEVDISHLSSQIVIVNIDGESVKVDLKK